MPPKSDDNGNGDVDDAFDIFKEKMSIERRLEVVHQQLLFTRKDLKEMKEHVAYKDTCVAIHSAEDARHARTESDVRELKEGNKFGITTGLVILSLIISAVAIITVVM